MASALSDRSFGIELECIVRHAEPATSNKRQYTIVAGHIKSETNLNIIHPEDPRYHEYQLGRIKREEWMITSDPSVGVDNNDFRYSRERQLYPHMSLYTWTQLWNGAEIVSPILNENNWEEVASILNAIQTPPMGVIHNKSTSTHFHIGIQRHSEAPLDAELGLHDIKRVAAIYYIFETYLNLLCPDHRVNDYCHRTRRSYFAKRNTQREFCEAIYNLENLTDVHDFINCQGIIGDKEPIPSRYFGGNFANCMQVWQKWTVEFRSHEGTKDSESLESWGKLLLRLFDQATTAGWDYVMYLCDTSESYNAKKICGNENDRDLDAWRLWITSMHHLFVMFLAGSAFRDKHLNPEKPTTLEQYILSQPQEMTDEEYADINVRRVREEEILLQKLITYVTARERKFKPQYERFMEGNFEDWSSDHPRETLPSDWVDYPNPSGIVNDHIGRDIPVSWNRISNVNYSLYPAVG